MAKVGGGPKSLYFNSLIRLTNSSESLSMLSIWRGSIVSATTKGSFVSLSTTSVILSRNDFMKASSLMDGDVSPLSELNKRLSRARSVFGVICVVWK
eukprot:CAMPEP_0194386276 /NCGR_PEP_ID=MMETSP0174-20130528/85437_1 /TAXON_ID=216777 /ORGANISM="Proboscia alata, Strain PI-D3" /LENGTH=96 /DNA_ID=CAMNT_0039175289 /DNA_START=1029 /DNA_END=1319 /DNA_ORIENTATION=+